MYRFVSRQVTQNEFREIEAHGLRAFMPRSNFQYHAICVEVRDGSLDRLSRVFVSTRRNMARDDYENPLQVHPADAVRKGDHGRPCGAAANPADCGDWLGAKARVPAERHVVRDVTRIREERLLEACYSNIA